MTNRTKWMFVQLPVVSHDFKDNLAHIPYGSMVVCTYLSSKIQGIEFIRIDKRSESIGADSLIIDNILKIQPDVLCFSLYLWNIERSLYIANRIKEVLEDVFIIVGGPEVNVDNNFLLNKGGFDVGILGEGEEVLYIIGDYLLSIGREKFDPVGLRKIGTWNFRDKIFVQGILTDLSNVPSVYRDKDSISFDHTMLIESLRGCANRCGYCYYPKNFKGIRYFPISRVLKEIRWAKEMGVEDVSFIDPSFLKRRDLKEFLKEISGVIKKDSGPSIFCELNAEDVSDEAADLLKGINVKSTEIGLQSINRKTLELINRQFHRERFIQGVSKLKNRGIDVLLDLIVGLPGDGYKDVCRGIDFVLENDLMDDMGIYPLSLLPGTQLRGDSQKLGINYLDSPPYIVENTHTMSREDIVSSFFYAEEVSGLDLFPREFPILEPTSDFLFSHDAEPVYFMELTDRGMGVKDFLAGYINNLTSPFIIKISNHRWFKSSEDLFELLSTILNNNPYMLMDIVINDSITRKIDLFSILKTLRPVMSPRDYYLDRFYMDSIDPLRSTQLFLHMQGPWDRSCLVSIPSRWYFNRVGCVFWFMVYGEEDVELEDYFIGRFENILQEEFNYRISYAQNGLEKRLKGVLPLGKREIGL